jgi:hypothetical protein
MMSHLMPTITPFRAPNDVIDARRWEPPDSLMTYTIHLSPHPPDPSISTVSTPGAAEVCLALRTTGAEEERPALQGELIARGSLVARSIDSLMSR